MWCCWSGSTSKGDVFGKCQLFCRPDLGDAQIEIPLSLFFHNFQISPLRSSKLTEFRTRRISQGKVPHRSPSKAPHHLPRRILLSVHQNSSTRKSAVRLFDFLGPLTDTTILAWEVPVVSLAVYTRPCGLLHSAEGSPIPFCTAILA